MWILDRLMPESRLYNETMLMHFRRAGRIPLAIERSLNEIDPQARGVADDVPAGRRPRLVQVIAPELTIAVPVVDLPVPGRTPCRRRSNALARVEGRRRLFDLARGPLIRAVLLRGAEEWALVVTLHHIVCDGWSICVLVRELAVDREGVLRGRALAARRSSPCSTRTSRSGSGAGSRGQPLDRELQYWRKQLADVPVLQLPYDRPRPALPEP